MKKKVLTISMICLSLAGLLISAQKVAWSSGNEVIPKLLSQNVEALSSSTESDSGCFTIKFCSRKPGRKLCSAKKGNRKWVEEIEFTFHTGLSEDSGCRMCQEDNDYEKFEE